eukprot:TRINITY_DN11990_c0_g2_i3.p1 TRINITY_DN11990_c0_g2~~TRINITY_DN11990_c0_g2_i3.p1  ORF type:complete len:528 (+),score=65.93 TRINITY_DN11990_c0_g2_i3:561-2144(+)
MEQRRKRSSAIMVKALMKIETTTGLFVCMVKIREFQGFVIFQGENSTHIPAKTNWEIFVTEILNPFYFFQACAVTAWFLDEYIYYAGVILFLTLISAFSNFYEAKTNYNAIREKTFHESEVYVYRDQTENLADLVNKLQRTVKLGPSDFPVLKKRLVKSSHVVPGDIIEIPENQIMPCDIILLTGSVMMNESMLTGESVAVTKNALPAIEASFNAEQDKQHIIFSGTQSMECKIAYKGLLPVLGMAAQTGFNTMKGQLVRALVFQKAQDFRFYTDAFKYIALLAIIASFGMVYGFYIQYSLGKPMKEVILRTLDIIFIVIPPALPALLTIGITIVLTRLREQDIYCISPNRINTAGKIGVACFDKTGTLTEDGSDVYGLKICEFHEEKRTIRFRKKEYSPNTLLDDKPREQTKNEIISRLKLPSSSFNGYGRTSFENQACCHSITRFGGEFVGDPIDVKMFLSTGCEYEDNPDHLPKGVLAKITRAESSIVPAMNLNIISRFEFSITSIRTSLIFNSYSWISLLFSH